MWWHSNISKELDPLSIEGHRAVGACDADGVSAPVGDVMAEAEFLLGAGEG